MSMKIDRIQDNRIKWGASYWDQNSEPYQVLEGEVDYAVSCAAVFTPICSNLVKTTFHFFFIPTLLQIDSAMALTSFSGIFVDSKVNKFYQMNGAVTVNTTIEMEENAYTKSEVVKRDIKRKLIEVIQDKPARLIIRLLFGFASDSVFIELKLRERAGTYLV